MELVHYIFAELSQLPPINAKSQKTIYYDSSNRKTLQRKLKISLVVSSYFLDMTILECPSDWLPLTTRVIVVKNQTLEAMLDLDLEHGEQYSVGFFFSRSGKKNRFHFTYLPTFLPKPLFSMCQPGKKSRTPLI